MVWINARKGVLYETGMFRLWPSLWLTLRTGQRRLGLRGTNPRGVPGIIESENTQPYTRCVLGFRLPASSIIGGVSGVSSDVGACGGDVVLRSIGDGQ